MKTSPSKQAFIDAFKDYNLSDHFSDEAKERLYDFYANAGAEWSGAFEELDMDGICQDWTEYDKAGTTYYPKNELTEEEVLEFEQKTEVLRLSTGYLIAVYP